MEQNKLVYKEKVLNIKENKEEMIEQYLSIFLRDNHMANSFSMSRYLTFINISHSRISKIPTGFGTLPHLESLDLSDNILGENNDKNRWLWLSQTAIQNNLLSLDLSNNSLTELPIQVMRLNMLKTLKISHNKLKYLPQSIINLQRLSILDVSHNILGQNNDKNRWLWLSQTAIQNNLLSLDLSNNSLTELPIQVMRLNMLKTLKISHNKLKYLPQSIRNLQRLSILDVSHNILGQNNDKNRWLWLSQTAIQNNLLSLDLSNNSLTELPIQVMRLNMLKTLKISHNKLKYLPQSIINLQRLSILDVSHNSLVYLPQSICFLLLDRTDITMNPFSQALDIINLSLDTIIRYPFLYNSIDYAININNEVPRLIKLSFSKIIQQRITYDTSEIPRTLIEYLDKVAKYCCDCGKPCFGSYIWDLTYCFPRCPMARGVQMSDNIDLLFERYSCSNNCIYKHSLTIMREM